MRSVGVLGAGSFGTALATVLSASGAEVNLWVRREELARQIATTRENSDYLPGVELPPSVGVSHELADLAAHDVVILAVPSHGLRQVLADFLRLASGDRPLVVVSAAKGIEVETVARMSRVAAEEAAAAGRGVRFAALSGPNFASELAQGMPSLAVVASEEHDLAVRLQELLATPRFRRYTSSDVVGVEIGGATKNVIAIAAGALTGLGFGHNTMAALITRGLHEMARLGVASGGQAETFSGLAGLGDLVLTCTGGLSRNRRTGELLAAGRSLAEITGGSSQVAEGVKSSLAIRRLAAELDIEMPITEQMVEVMHGGKSPRLALEELMARDLKREAVR